MKALVLCEVSGIWSEALWRRGYDVLQVDLAMPGLNVGDMVGRSDWVRMRGDVMQVSFEKFDVVCAFPPCTHLALSGARYWASKAGSGDVLSAMALLTRCAKLAAGSRVAGVVENPRGLASRVLGCASLECHPWEFASGPDEHRMKRTALWLYGWPLVLRMSGCSRRPLTMVEWGSGLDGREARAALRSHAWVGMASAFVAALPFGGRSC